MFLPEMKLEYVNGQIKTTLYKAYYKCKECNEITHSYGSHFNCDCCGAKYLITNEIVDMMERT